MVTQTTAEPSLATRALAELTGTFLLTFSLIGTAVYMGALPAKAPGVGDLGVALSLGLAVFVGGIAFGPISGGHFNPAVTVGLASAGMFAWRRVIAYVVAQVIGGIAGVQVVVAITSGAPDNYLARALDGGFASNGFDGNSPGGFDLGSVIALEVVGTALFVVVIAGAISASSDLGPLAIGLTLTLLVLIGLPVDNAGFNPARSISTAIVAGDGWLGQVWVFVLFPLLGGAIGGLFSRVLRRTRSRGDLS